MRTRPKTERKIMTVTWGIVLTMVTAFCIQAQSVHVTSVRRRREEYGTVFSIDIENPTDEDVVAMIRLMTGNLPSDKGSPGGIVTHRFPVTVPANKTITYEKTFEGVHGKILGPDHSAVVASVSGCSRTNLAE